jgi:23S rRNA pseudouridine1911/1915/1917 synthase
LRELFAFEIATGGQISIVNRLDRETSGLVLVAKTAAEARRFGLLMQRHRLQKEYLAIIWGWPAWEHYSADAPLDRQSKHKQSAIWLKQMIHPNGAPAQTEFHVEQRFIRPSGGTRSERARRIDGAPFGSAADEKFAVIRAIPLTGRTHQIRVHLASIGHPIVGDKIYGSDEKLYLRFIETGWTPQLEQRLLLPRQALHSAKLTIEGEREWTSPLPRDLAEFTAQGCRAAASGRRSAPTLPIAIRPSTPIVAPPYENASRVRCFFAGPYVLAKFCRHRPAGCCHGD